MDSGKTPPKLRAADIRHILLVLPFILQDLLRPEVEAHNAQIPPADHVVDPSAELIEVVLVLLTWYRLFRRRSPAKDEVDIEELSYLAHRYFEKCTVLFPFVNGHGFNIMHNEKNHSMEHGGADIARWADLINMSGEAPEGGHKFWIKEPGGCTNQGPAAALTMMNHVLRKQASKLLCEAVEVNSLYSFNHFIGLFVSDFM